MKGADLVQELYEMMREGNTELHRGEDGELCGLVDEVVEAIEMHPQIGKIMLEDFEEGNPTMAFHRLFHFLFDCARLYEMKAGTRTSFEDAPPVEIDMNVWGTGWDGGGDL